MVLLVAFTGAGISVASGLPTFEGSYRGIPVREILEKDFFLEHTRFFYDYYREVLMGWPDAEPNEAHIAIAACGCPVVTQNIDGLHQKAGSAHTIELHGNLRELVCEHCGRIAPSALAKTAGVPLCPGCGRVTKPNVVLFGEGLPSFGEAETIMAKATTVLVVGTSLMVYPAAGLVDAARARGARIVLVNSGARERVPAALEGLRAP